MLWYSLRRAGLLVLSLALASALIFALLRLLPGDVATTIGGAQATPAQVDAIRAGLGLNRPLHEQYLSWVGGLFHGDFGRSQLNGTSVGSELALKLAVTGPLIIGSLLVAFTVAVPLGAWSAMRHRSRIGGLMNALSQIGIAVPALWLAMLLILVFAVELKLLPAQGFPVDRWGHPGDAARSLVLPCVTLGLVEGAVLFRFVRSATMGVLYSDYLRTARAKGLPWAQALVRHGFRNAALPVVSVLGLQSATLIVGAVVIERVFTLPGVGSMLLSDVANRDLVKVQGEMLLLIAAILVIGFVVDLIHRLIDPRLEARL
ncbi:ABC transporter permease [Nocardia pseudobrasiliensis]|uniref:Peptide/nickel transport system permease protein n=1 Tax=Nocardia pseudobrasiliensis TaxID=45979 RepID=A0A370HPY8_9NOCA|nr:ABC transporter permease [Nocardia pseudobrasiliensis]RDI60335.1 peptide/nickel transport system permease protein [Nocardia pseudobrasiliensis]